MKSEDINCDDDLMKSTKFNEKCNDYGPQNEYSRDRDYNHDQAILAISHIAATFYGGLMADGEQIRPPPPHEVGVHSPINTSLSHSKPPLFSAFAQGQCKKQSQPLLVNTKVQSLEDGEIPPLHLNKSNPFLPISEVSSIDPTSLCQDSFSLKPLSIFEGKPCVLFKSSEKKTLISNHKYVLVEKFSHGRPPLSTIKVFYDVVPPYCSSCLHIEHHVDVCKKRKSVVLAEVAQHVKKLGLGNSAFKVFDGSSQPAAPSIFAPSSSIPAGVNYKDEKKATQSQIWIEVQGTNVLKSQKMTTYHKDKDLPTENKFSSLLLPASSGSDICVDSTVLMIRTGLAKETDKIKGVQLVAKNGDAQTILLVENEAIPQDELVVQNSPKKLSKQSGNKVNNHADGSENLVATQLGQINAELQTKVSRTAHLEPDTGMEEEGVSSDCIVTESVLIPRVAAPDLPASDVAIELVKLDRTVPIQQKREIARHLSSVENKVSTWADSVDEEEQQTKAMFSELVAMKEWNEGLPLKHKAIAKSDKTQKTTRIDTEVKKYVDTVDKEKIPRTEQQEGKKQHLAKDDTYVKQ
ncbi:hypothetical protein LIER_16516 [Lithospermum erythrorhizon]|uniref:Uncharacterized protein n=1 Tax=Lithospermum erythrorhizon TaxID=34254 RepID=A0AAV3Q7S6_LITER